MKITVLNTGGTFNKRYNPLKGELEVPTDNIALDEIIEACHNLDMDIKNIISKDSLEMNDADRAEIVRNIEDANNDKIIIIHGTDTVDLTAKYISERVKDKIVILTGAMVPMSIKKVEATMNFSLALGAMSGQLKNGVYVAMHGVVLPHVALKKNKIEGKFLVSGI